MKIYKKGEGIFFTMISVDMKENGNWVIKMELDKCIIIVEQSIMEIGKIIKSMEEDFYIFHQERSMKENGKNKKKKDLEY